MKARGSRQYDIDEGRRDQVPQPKTFKKRIEQAQYVGVSNCVPLQDMQAAGADAINTDGSFSSSGLSRTVAMVPLKARS